MRSAPCSGRGGYPPFRGAYCLPTAPSRRRPEATAHLEIDTADRAQPPEAGGHCSPWRSTLPTAPSRRRPEATAHLEIDTADRAQPPEAGGHCSPGDRHCRPRPAAGGRRPLLTWRSRLPKTDSQKNPVDVCRMVFYDSHVVRFPPPRKGFSKMPRSGSYPADNGREEVLQIDAIDGFHYAFRVMRNDYSVTVYADGSFGIVLPESIRQTVELQTGADTLCIRAVSYCAVRI